ncbi:MAG: hypothetical protein OEY93_04155, partial [Anaerolineae bacterium]|nr:hypothetical protein [Anaerolineae bacterium]
WVIACSNACSALNSSDSGYRGFPVVSAVSASDHTFSDKISVTWQTDITYDRYEVYRHTSDNSASAALLDGSVLLTGYEDISVVAGKKYFYWVKACNTYGCSGFSASDFGISDLPAPTNLTASDGTHIDKIELSWNPVTNAETYRVFRHTSSDFSLATLLQTDITGTRYADTSAEAGTTYYYWVQACGDFCGKVSATDTGSLANPSISLPFSDGFETGDLSKWSNVYNGNEKLPACNLCVQQSASLKGKFGLAVNILDKQSHFLEDFSPENENRYHARFYIDVSGLQMPNGSNLNIFEGRSGQKKVFSLQLRHYNKKFWVRGLISSNTGKIFQTGWTVVPNGPTAIEIDWNSTRSQFKQDGFIKLWVNGELRQKKTGVANSTLSLDEVLLGITSPIEAAYNISGSFYLDDFISNNLNYIGP